MKHLIHLIDDKKFKLVPDLDEIGHYEIVGQKERTQRREKNE